MSNLVTLTIVSEVFLLLSFIIYYFINQESEKKCSLGHLVHHWSCTAFIFSHRSCEKRLYGRKYRTRPCLYVYLVIQRSCFYHWHHSFSEKEKE